MPGEVIVGFIALGTLVAAVYSTVIVLPRPLLKEVIRSGLGPEAVNNEKPSTLRFVVKKSGLPSPVKSPTRQFGPDTFQLPLGTLP